jgi:hypothetical protein
MLTTAPPTGSPTGPLADGPATLPQGWLAVADRRLGGAAIPLVLLHPRHGVVLAGGPADGPALLRQRLAAGRFPAIFHGHLPIARTDRPPADPAATLQGEAPLSLPGGEAWVLAVCRALENEAPIGPPRRLGIRARRRRNRRRLAVALGGTAALVLLLGLGLASLPPSPLPSSPLAASSIPPRTAGGAAPGETAGGLPPPTMAQAAIAPPASPPALAESGGAAPVLAEPVLAEPVLAEPGLPGAVPSVPILAAPVLLTPLAIPPPPGPLALAPAPPAIGEIPPPRAPAAAPWPVASPIEPEGAEAPASVAMPAPRGAPEAMMIARAGRIAAQPVGPAMRCRLITQRMQIGETVTDADIQFLRLGCPG